MNSQAPDVLQEALQHHRAGRIDRAVLLYRQALRSDPDNVALLLTMGTLLLQRGQVADCKSLLARATSLQSGNADAWMALGNAELRSGALTEAERAFARAAELRPGLSALHVNHGNVLRRLGRIEPAISSYRKAIALEPSLAQAHFNLGNALSDHGTLEEAAQAFEAAIAIKPDYLAARNNLGNTRLRQLRHHDALACFTSIMATDPAFPRARYNLGVVQQELGMHDDAIASFRAVLQGDSTDLAALNNLCISLLRNNQPVEALTTCDAFLALAPENRKAMAYKAAALLEMGERQRAGELLDYEGLLDRVTIEPPAGFQSLVEFNSKLARVIQRHPSLRYEPPDKSTHGGSQTGELMTMPDPSLQQLRHAIESAVANYIEHLRSTMPMHPYVAGLPRRWRLATWAVVLKSNGHQGPHFHPDGSVSGVYYVQLPDSMDPGMDDAGSIEFGRTSEAFGSSQPPLIEVVRPEAGLMLLFPSYFYHRTIPFEAGEPRISVAFDVLADE